MNQDKFLSKEAFLLEALDYYTVDPDNRRCVNDTSCVYSPITINKPSSEGCLIGRNLSKENAICLDKEESIGINDIFTVEELLVLLPNKMIDLGQNFLMRCQRLHDFGLNWNSKGLSKGGVNKLKDIIIHCDLDRKAFSKYLIDETLT